MGKVKKEKLEKKEFRFNLISGIILGGLFLFFGARFVYYFTYELSEAKDKDNTASYYILNGSKIVTDGDGLYQKGDEYIFKGDVTNNYVTYGNILYRVISIDSEGNMKLVAENNAASFMWGDFDNYTESNLNNWLSDAGEYYDMLINPEEYLVKTEYTEETLEDNKIVKSEDIMSSYVTTLTASDYVNAGGKESYLNNETYFWLIGKDNETNLYVNSEGNTLKDDTFSSFGVRPVITISADVLRLRGSGEETNPLYIDVKDDKTYINTYVQLGDNLYKTYDINDNIMMLSSTDYLKVNGEVYSMAYNTDTTSFDPSDYGTLAHYLNSTYLDSLSYKDILIDCTFNTGEVTDENKNAYSNIFEASVTAKVGLLNIFDYNNNSLYDYYYLTNTGIVSEIAYVKSSAGILKKTQVIDEKSIVPVVCIDKSKIVDGTGNEYSPYVLE